MKKLIILISLVSLLLVGNLIAQIPVIRESNKQEIAQTIGDSKVSIVYYRPNVKARLGKIYGCSTDKVIQQGNNTGDCLVPNGQVWRTGANDNTVIEFATDVTINGQNLPAGKYGFFAIPDKKEWTLIFNKVTNEWGAFNYKAEQDALRIKVIPTKLKTSRETMMFEFNSVIYNSSMVTLSWEKLAVSFTVNVGDVNGRVLAKIRDVIKAAKADDIAPLNQGANFVIGSKIAASYDEAMGWLNKSISIRETFGNLASKARLLAEMGKTAEAISLGEKAVEIGKAAKVNTTNFEKIISDWKLSQQKPKK